MQRSCAGAFHFALAAYEIGWTNYDQLRHYSSLLSHPALVSIPLSLEYVSPHARHSLRFGLPPGPRHMRRLHWHRNACCVAAAGSAAEQLSFPVPIPTARHFAGSRQSRCVATKRNVRRPADDACYHFPLPSRGVGSDRFSRQRRLLRAAVNALPAQDNVFRKAKLCQFSLPDCLA